MEYGWRWRVGGTFEFVLGVLTIRKQECRNEGEGKGKSENFYRPINKLHLLS
jgi:hypothetical protein